MRWHRQTLEDKTAREPVTKEATVEELLVVMLENFEKLVRHITFIKHLSVAQWQHHQYRYLKENLKQNKVMLVMDSAENVSSQSQDEIKSVFQQTTNNSASCDSVLSLQTNGRAHPPCNQVHYQQTNKKHQKNLKLS